jgi:opacity protein-like surface antigen
MNKRFFIRLAILFLCISAASYADMTMTQIRTTQDVKDGKESGTPKSETSTLWIAADKMRMDGETESVLLMAAKDSLYLIDNKKKTYTGIALSQIASPAAQAQDMPPEMASMMGNMMKMEITIEPTTETKTINTWKCTKYTQTLKMMGTSTISELWATTDVKVDPVMVKKFMSSLFLKNQSMKDLAAQMQKEYEKIKGYVVYSVTTTGLSGKETRITSEVRDVKEATAPAGTYDIPAKFKMKKWE